MKVFAVTAKGTYGAGIVIVAADTTEEAAAIAAKSDGGYWSVRYDKPDFIEEIEGLTAEKSGWLYQKEWGE